MDPDHPEETNGQNSSRVAPEVSTIGALTADSMSQFASLVAQLMGDAQSRMVASKVEEGDRHLQSFLRLNPPHFKGAVGPQAAEDWLLRVEKTFDGMQCPESRKVPLAVFLLDGEAERWWLGQQLEKCQGKTNADISWEQFSDIFREWFVPMSARQQMQESFLRLTQGSRSVMQYEAEFTALSRYAPQLISTPDEKCYRFLHGLRHDLRHPLVPLRLREFSELVERARLIENDLPAVQQQGEVNRRRFGSESFRSGATGKRSRFGPSASGKCSTSFGGRSVSGSASSANGAPQCALCGKRHFGRCLLFSGHCFRCGQQGHRIAQCPQRPSEGRVETRTEQRFDRGQSSSGPRGFSEGSSSRGGGRFSKRQSGMVPRDSVVSVASTPTQARVYSLSQQEARDSVDVVTGTYSVSAQS